MPAVMLFVFAFTLFCSASLLFLIEPMVGKMMLPLLGGTPAVWNTCMVFFQAVLLAGYAYSHWSTTWLGARRQAALQVFVLFLPFVAIGINASLFSGMLTPNENLILGWEGNPIPALLLVLTLSVGVPMFVVCTSAPLLQRWFSSTDHPAARDPYFLYGASNLGSMLMLMGYPAVVEPYLSLKGQQTVWVIGYCLLTLMVIVCAFLTWNAKTATDPQSPTPPSPDTGGDLAASNYPEGIKAAEKGIARKSDRPARGESADLPIAPPPGGPSSEPVTWIRRLRWIALAIVPSSLMLGATTYITTDIAAIPLLWVLPLTLYLLTFIIVFAHISSRTQSIVTLVVLDLILVAVIVYAPPLVLKEGSYIWLVRLIGVVLFCSSFLLLKVQDNQLLHRVMIMVMPLLVLLLIFMMLADIKRWQVANIVLNAAVLFIISMVCHGELARDRPEPSKLTEYFLWMSFGGVVGGLFNGLFAPVAFNSLVEYPFMIVVACLLLPPLGLARDSVWARRADLALALVFVAVGGLLVYLRSRDANNLPELTLLKRSSWEWGLAALGLMVLLGIVSAVLNWSPRPALENGSDEPLEKDHWLDRSLDVILPFTLLVLFLGLYWGLDATGVRGRLTGFAKMVNMDQRQFRVIITFGLPAVLCYTFVERSVRFGLGVGVILLGAGFSNFIEDPALYQKRSFFGVLRVESGVNYKEGYPYPFHRLVHGTTLHGKQYLSEGVTGVPLSYYHRTGPVGQVFRAYNNDPRRPMAVIGLGTGTMACYGLEGQTLDFYDIDPEVVDISFDSTEYFSFVEDAEDRGVDVNLILGDARLTFRPQGEKPRLKPLHKRADEKPVPERKFGKPLNEEFKYGLVVVDAFSSDAIPMHLITKEAVKIYFDRLMEGGVVCMHISNRYLDLQPVLANIADQLTKEGYPVVGYHMSDDDESAAGKNKSHWVALARSKKDLAGILERPRWERDADQLALLAVAQWPAPGASLASGCGLALAFREIADLQGRLAFAAEGLPGKPDMVATTWTPLDSPSVLESEPELAREKIAEIDKVLAKREPRLEEVRKRYKEVEDSSEKPLKEARKLIEEGAQELKQIELQISASSGPMKAELTKRLADLEKKRLEASEQVKKLQARLDEVALPKEWEERIDEALKERKKQHQNVISSAPDKLAKDRRVGVWTDDYSNLLSVFSW